MVTSVIPDSDSITVLNNAEILALLLRISPPKPKPSKPGKPSATPPRY